MTPSPGSRLGGLRSRWRSGSRRCCPWGVPCASVPLLRDYGDLWLEGRKTRGRELRPTTRQQYQMLLDTYIYPTFGDERRDRITADDVTKWYDALAPGKETIRAPAYSLVRTVLGSAASARPTPLIPYNPAHIRGAGNVKRAHKVRPASLQELETIVDALPDRYQITRGVVRVGGTLVVGSPKSGAGVRDVAIPPHLLPAVKVHLKNHTDRAKDALLFPAAADSNAHMAPSTLYKVYYPARKAAGREDLRRHDLRHTGAVLAVQTGATLAC